MRLLIWSDFAQTGFGRVGRELGHRFMEEGVDLRCLAINWRGRLGEMNAVASKGANGDQVGQWLNAFDSDPLHNKMVPAGLLGDLMGGNMLPGIFDGSLFTDHWTPEGVLVVADPRAMSDRWTQFHGLLGRVPVWNYVPIEGANLPPCWDSLWAHVQPVAMSAFGQRELSKILGRPVPNIPHGLSDMFWPITPQRPSGFHDRVLRTKDDAKAVWNLQGRTVFLRTDRLVPRKNYGALFRTMAPILEADPTRVLVVHCAPRDEGGLMAEFISHLPGSFGVGDVWRHPQIIFTGGHDTFSGLSDEDLNSLYNAADVYVSPTSSEGFGLCLLEAGACAVPVVTTRYAAGPEAVGPGGVLIEPASYVTSTAAHDWALVDEPAFTDAVEHLANDPAERARLGALGAQHARTYSWDDAAADFLALMH